MTESQAPLHFPCGKLMNNRFMLAPMTNQQSNEDGRISQDEIDWLVMRAKGQFGLVMTCASHVQEVGKGFAGQLGIFSDLHVDGHRKLTSGIKKHGSLAVIQLHHAGMRSPAKLIGKSPVSPSGDEKTGARPLSLEEVDELRVDFINAALRAKQSGYDGVEIHGAHGYILTQFLSSTMNKRKDDYGGNLEGRSRILFEIVNGIRTVCGSEFLVGVRLSPEKFGLDLIEVISVCQQLINDAKIDFLDISLWDYLKLPEQKVHQSKTLLAYFTALDRKSVRLTVAGKIRNGKDVASVLNSNVDFVSIGRSAILHHDFPVRVINDPEFKPAETPVSEDYLHKEGLGKKFVNYMRRWPDFVAP